MSEMTPHTSPVRDNNPDRKDTMTKSTALLAMAATLVAIVVQFAGGLAQVEWLADDGMRLVQVRDLVAGQSWFDSTQYRLGPHGGTLMHWSRLIDAPIALIIAVASAITGDMALAERIASYVWPALLLYFALWAIAVAARWAGSNAATGAALILGAFTLLLLPDFQPGGFDHHGAQIVLGLWVIAFLLTCENQLRNHALAGAFAVLMLAIGMEALPYVTAIGIWVALSFLVGVTDVKTARAFGLALPATAFIVFFGIISPAQYANRSCDAYSLFHVIMASAGGIGLVIATLVRRNSVLQLFVLGAASAVICALALTVFRDCVATPLSELDPLMRQYWLDNIVEAQSIFDAWRAYPSRVIGALGLPATGLIVVMIFALSPAQPQHKRVAATLYALLIALAIAVSVWQVRAAVFALAFALVPMALWVVSARASYIKHRSKEALAGLVLAWALSFYPLWLMPNIVTQATDESHLATDVGLSQCFQAENVAHLASIEPPTGGSTLLAARFDAAVPLLLGTNHHVLSGNYHRNTSGNLAWISMMLATPADAAVIARAHGVTHIVDCQGAWEGHVFAGDAPGGLQASLNDGNVPSWLTPLPLELEGSLRVYQVVMR